MSSRPRVVTWNIASLDGRIAISRSVPVWLDERWTHIERAGFEMVDVALLHDTKVTLGGSNNFVPREAGPADFPQPPSTTDLCEDFLPAHVVAKAERWMAIIDSRGRVPWTQTEGNGAYLIVLVSQSTPPGYLAFLRDRDVPYLLSGDQRVDLSLALERLRDTFRVETVLSDAGGVLNGALLRAGLVDEIDLQLLPVVVGVPEAPAVFEGFELGLNNRPLRLKPLHSEARSDGSVFLRFTPESSREIEG